MVERIGRPGSVGLKPCTQKPQRAPYCICAFQRSWLLPEPDNTQGRHVGMATSDHSERFCRIEGDCAGRECNDLLSGVDDITVSTSITIHAQRAGVGLTDKYRPVAPL